MPNWYPTGSQTITVRFVADQTTNTTSGWYAPMNATTGYTAGWTQLPYPTAQPGAGGREVRSRRLDGDVVSGNGGWVNPGRASADPEAQRKARELLMDHLTPEQQHMYEQFGYFDVPVADDDQGDVWRIKGYEGVFRVQPFHRDLEDGSPEDDHELEKLCIHIASGYAEADCQLSQLVLLETDPDGFFRMANLHWKRPRLGPPDPKVAEALAEIDGVLERAEGVREVESLV